MLQNCTKANTKSLEDFIPKGEISAKVLDVYDGDTIWVAYLNPYLNVPIKSKVRLTRINAPEIRGKSGESAKDKKDRSTAANKSKDMVSYIVHGKIIKLNVLGLDKYSRLLCDVLVPEEEWVKTGLEGEVVNKYVDLSNFLLKGGYAVEY